MFTEDAQLKEVIAQPFCNILSIVAKCDENKSEDDSSVIVQYTEGNTYEDRLELKASAISDHD